MRLRRVVAVFGIVLLVVLPLFQVANVVGAVPPVARYTVEITSAGANRHVLSVKAVLNLPGATLLSVEPPSDYMGSWVTIERCYDSVGPLTAEKIDERTWRVTPRSPSDVTIEYSASPNMPNRMTEGTYLTYLSGECGLIYSKSILLAPVTPVAATVEWVLPQGWTVIVDERWTRIGNATFSVSTGDLDLVAPGRFSVYTDTFGDGQTLRVAVSGATRHPEAEYIKNIKFCLDYFTEHVGRVPQGELDLVLADLPLPNDYMSGTPRLAVNRVDGNWGMFEGMLWHYLFLKSAVYSNEADKDPVWWFGEGVSPFILYPVYEGIGAAEEVANAWGFRQPTLDWGNWYAIYEPYIGTKYDIPLVEYPAKSRETGDPGYYAPMPYMKSSIVLKMFDLSLVEVTRGEKDLRDVLRYLYDNYILKGVGYKITDIKAAVDAVSGVDYSAFFDAYVYGGERLPVVVSGDRYLFDWATLGDKVYALTPNIGKVRPSTQRSVPEGETATLLELKKESRHFTVYFHGKDSRMAALLLLDSEKAYDSVAKLYGGDAKLRIRLFMTYDGAEYVALSGNPSMVYGQDASAGSVAVEAGDEINWLRPVPLAATQMTDLAAPIHELGHAMLRQIYPGVYKNWEQWFNEGMPLGQMAWLDAEWGADRPPFDISTTDQLKTTLLTGMPPLIPLFKLAGMDYGSLTDAEKLLDSGEGIAFHFYVSARYENGLPRLLAEYGKGVPLSAAVENAFGVTYAELEADLWTTALKAVRNADAAEAVTAMVRREGVDVAIAEKLTKLDRFLSTLVAYALEERARAGPVRLSFGSVAAGASAKLELATTPIASVSVAPTVEINGLVVMAQEVEPTGVTPIPKGRVYCYLSLNSTGGSLGRVTLVLRVENSWMNVSDVAASDVVLSRLRDGVWSPLPTNETGRDASYTYYSAASDGLSLFAVTASKREVAQPSPDIGFWVSPTPFGSATTAFLVADGIYPTVENRETDEPVITVTLLDDKDGILFERSYSAPHGLTGFDDYNPGKSLQPGSYRVKVHSGSILLGVLDLAVSEPPPPATSETNSSQTPSAPPVTGPSASGGIPGYPYEAVLLGLILAAVVLFHRSRRSS
jgi:PGF-pre-PGF domain-containing protein